MKATWDGTVIAQSDDIVTVEGNAYFPAAALNRQYVVDSGTRSTCHWKGVASYYTLDVNGQKNPDAVWFYPTPKAGAEQVKDRVAFWKGVKVEA